MIQPASWAGSERLVYHFFVNLFQQLLVAQLFRGQHLKQALSASSSSRVRTGAFLAVPASLV
jgi:hypothetical protein